MDKTFLFFILALVMFWLAMSEAFGDKYITKFVLAILPDAEG